METIHRGQQYVRAIRVYYSLVGSYPASLEALEKTNNQRFLRQGYIDPLTGKSDWRLIPVGQNKTTVKGFFGQPLGGIAGGGLGSASGMASSGMTGAGAAGTSGLGSGSANGSDSSAFGSSSVGSSFGSSGPGSSGLGASSAGSSGSGSGFGSGSGLVRGRVWIGAEHGAVRRGGTAQEREV